MNVLAVCEKPQGAQLNETQPHVIQFKTQEAPVYYGGDQSRLTADEPVPAVIKVVSAGGGGGNALNRMLEEGLGKVQFIALNTDIQDLHNKSRADVKIQIGAKVTGGRGAGGVPDKGEKAALEDQDAIADVLMGADMVFITAGMGGGTGTGSVPVVARIAKELGALTVAVVTTPFEFEGRYKMRLAMEGIEKLRKEVDTLIVIPNQHLFKIVDSATSYNNAYLLADEVLCHAVQGISEIIDQTGFLNTDFADVETIMKNKGDALMGIGFGSGKDRAMEAVMNAIDNPLLEDSSIDGATGVLVNITASPDLTMVEIQNIIKNIQEKCDQDVHLIHGLRIDPQLDDSIQVTVIATGFPSEECVETKQEWTTKANESDFIDYNEYARMVERTKHPEYLSYLPQREYQDDLDVPSVIRNYNYHTEEKTLELAEKV